MAGGCRSRGHSRLLGHFGMVQRDQRAGKMGGGREANLCGSRSAALMKVRGEVAGEWRFPRDNSCSQKLCLPRGLSEQGSRLRKGN